MWFAIGAVLASLSIAAIFFMSIWVPRVRGIRAENPSELHPKLIPVTTGMLVASYFTLAIGLWPAYHLLSPVILLVLGIGTIMVAHFLPAC